MMEMNKKKGILIPLIKLLIAVIFVVYVMGDILSLRGQTAQRRAETETLQNELAAQVTLNAALEEEASLAEAAQRWIRSEELTRDIGFEEVEGWIARAARAKGWVEPGEFIIVDMTP
jgi:hypothetical protein